MKTKHHKELTPVVYGENLIRILHTKNSPETLSFSTHWHDRLELHYVVSGSLNLYCNNENITVKENELSIISPRLPHGGTAGKDGLEYYVIMFDIHKLFNTNILSSKQLKAIVDEQMLFNYKTDEKQIISVVREIIRINTAASTHHPLESIGLLYSLLGLMLVNCLGETKVKVAENLQINNIVQYIDEHIADNISVASLSEKFGYNHSYFCRKFKKEMGCTVARYIRIQRLEYARKLLETTTQSIKLISSLCGFCDNSHFTRSFEEVYGFSPSSYRESKKKTQ